MNDFNITEHTNESGVKIVVVGVGGGGCNMVENFVNSEMADKVKLVAINTDKQALDNSNIPNKLEIGKNITGGKGAGMKPEIGRVAALENYQDIKDMLMKY